MLDIDTRLVLSFKLKTYFIRQITAYDYIISRTCLLSLDSTITISTRFQKTIDQAKHFISFDCTRN